MPNYNPYQFYPGYYQPQPQQNITPQQTQNSFITVSSELEARNYPVGPGNSVTFKDETAPYIYTKTMGFSQLDQPVFDKYKLIKEEQEKVEVKQENEELKKLREEIKMTDDDLDELREELKNLWGEINVLKSKRSAKREKDGDD